VIPTDRPHREHVEPSPRVPGQAEASFESADHSSADATPAPRAGVQTEDPIWRSITLAPIARASLDAPDDQRVQQLRTWLAGLQSPPGLKVESLRIASADASFRRYFRLDAQATTNEPRSWVAMDAPPAHEETGPFLRVQELLTAAGLRAPQVRAENPEQGFLLLSDFGDLTLLEAIRADPQGRWVEPRYRAAITALIRLQSKPAQQLQSVVPAYDRSLLMRELMLYPEWYVAGLKKIQLTARQTEQLTSAFTKLVDCALAQPRVLVHRDWHSRNLMVLADTDEPGVLDFQDAVYGPLTYDLVSLLRDAYIAWDEVRVLDWSVRYWEHARATGLPVANDFGSFWRDFEWMGLQRHLKVLGIFARLHLRDGKDRYLADLPRVLGYVRETVRRYDALKPLARIIDHVEREADEACAR